ncbi:type II toxin-antitoxin system HicB family antitoxin [Candidatus Daviesbacteria bacterium]|nr:type II toxin-antitoxin system HicB family antitoxin [Candidatus Daviesbacteria bacterium]
MLKSQKVSEYELPIKVEPQKEGGFVVTSPVWADCYAQGDSVDEAILEITAVAQSLIELYKEEGKHIPLKLQKEVDNLTSVPVIVAT